MPYTVPLGLKSYARTNGFQPEVELVNLVIEPDDSGASPDNVMRVQRPGLADFNSLAGLGRGITQTDQVLNGAWFAVYGNRLSRIFPDTTSIGNIAGSEQVAFAATFDAVFVLGGGVVYRWDGTNFATIPLPDDYTGIPVDIETLNSYVIIACSTGRFYWIVPGATTIDPLDFATAESSPDGLKSVRRLIDEFFLSGTISIEPWQVTGDLDAPFQKAGGRELPRGVLARDTMRRFDNSLLWVGENLIVYRVGPVPERVSDFGIEERLRKRAGTPSAWTFNADGHDYYVLDIPGQGTFAYDASSTKWSEFASNGRDRWQAGFGAQSPDMTLCGDFLTTGVYRVDPSLPTDSGIAQRRAVSGTVPLIGAGGRNGSFSLGIGASGDCTVKVRWRDGNDPYPNFFEELDVEAGANVVNLYRLGSFDRPFRTFQVEIDDPVMVRISGAVINGAYR